jgi:hypothetical protein
MDHGSAVPAPAPRVPGLRLQHVLGRGAHGEVWAAVDTGTGEEVAVKLRRTVAAAGEAQAPSAAPDEDDAEAAERLAREIALLRRIDHPHVVRLRRVLDLPGGSRALVLDRAAGGSLARLVRRRGGLQPGEVVTLVVTLARTLADLHVGGVVHGDLSPGNVLFAVDGRPLLSDLGQGAVLGTDCGTTRWATPGFADPAPGSAADPARDVWGLGAVGWFALAGRPPAAVPDPVPGPVPGTMPRTVPGTERAGDREQPPEPARNPWEGFEPAGEFGAGARRLGEGPGEPSPAGRAVLVRLLLRCLDADPVRRPSAAEVALLAWGSVPAAPVLLLPDPVDGDAGAEAGDVGGVDGDVGGGAENGAVQVGPGEAGEPGRGRATPAPHGRVVVGPWAPRRLAAIEAITAGLGAPGPGLSVADPRYRLDAVADGGAPSNWDRDDGRGVVAGRDGTTGGDGDDGEPFWDITRRVRDEAAADRQPGRAPLRRRLLDRLPRRGADRPGPTAGGVLRGLLVAIPVLVLLVAGGAWGLRERGTSPPGSAGSAGLGAAPRGAPSLAVGTSAVGSAAVGATAVAPSSSTAAACTAADPAAADLARTVCALATARAEAFRSASAPALARVDEPGSAAMAADAALVARLVKQGLRLDGVAFGISAVRVVARSADTVTLTAAVATSAHRQLRRDGSVAAQVAATPARPVKLVLVTGPATSQPGWLVRSAEAG